MVFAQIYTSSSPKKSMSPRDALLEGTDALTEQAHAASPTEALTGGRIPRTSIASPLFLLRKTYKWNTVMPAGLLPSVRTGT